jgi:hypothetical protein
MDRGGLDGDARFHERARAIRRRGHEQGDVHGGGELHRQVHDRRKHNVTLTPKGDAALERAETELRRLEDEVLAGLTADERAQLRKLMAKALETT